MTTTTTSAERTSATTITPALLITLALLSAVAPFAIDLYLPAFPTMVGDLPAIIPSVEGSAIATGHNTIWIDRADPFWAGFTVT